MTAAGPPPVISAAEADAAFAPLADAAGLLLAVSGGPDSLALLLLGADWARRRRSAGLQHPPLTVATVDHRLRPEAAAEAAMVARLAEDLGLPHHTLPWLGEKPDTGLQEAARHARLRLLHDAAQAAGASHVVTAHHADDQAETVLMRLAAGSGIGGLAGMRPLAPLGEIWLARPLLAFPKLRLAATVAAAGVAAAEDASNTDPRFARARWRTAAGILAAEGLSTARLNRLASRAARAEDALAAMTETAARQLLRRDAAGRLSVEMPALLREPEELALRVLARMIAAAAPSQEPARLERLEALWLALRHHHQTGEPLRRTLRGALLTLAEGSLAATPAPPRRSRRAAVAGPAARPTVTEPRSR